MPSSLAHVVVLTDDLDSVLRFLDDHARLGPVHPYDADPQGMADIFGWPVEQAATRGALIGSGPGMLEAVEIPEALRGQIEPGLALLAVPHRDADGAVASLRQAGLDARGPIEQRAPGGVQLRIVTTSVGGLPFELLQFGGDSAG